MRIGDMVFIRTQRPHISQFNGLRGKITTFAGFRASIAYVAVSECIRPFYVEELELVAKSMEGGAA